jgi:hypothetical protein
MSPDNGAIDHGVFQIRIVGKVNQHAAPDAVIAPTGIPFVNAIPGSVLDRQQPPLGTTPAYPEYRFDEATTIGFVASISIRVSREKFPNFLPMFVR